MDVGLTVDIEFSPAHCFSNRILGTPVGAEWVWCKDRHGSSQGLGFVLDVLGRTRLPATFFIETAHQRWFADDQMRNIVQTIRRSGHDLQLHVHPFWFGVERGMRAIPRKAPPDSLLRLSADEFDDLLGFCVATFADWGLPRPIAFRAAKLEIDEGSYPHLESVGITLSSSVGLGIHLPRSPRLQRHSFPVAYGGVVEVPIFSFRAEWFGADQLRTATVTGCSAAEIIHCLDWAAAAGCRQFIILTHPHEFVFRNSRYRDFTPNLLVQRRFATLCEYIADARGRFTPVTFVEAADRWRSAVDVTDRVCRTPRQLSSRRTLANGLNDLLGPFAPRLGAALLAG